LADEPLYQRKPGEKSSRIGKVFLQSQIARYPNLPPQSPSDINNEKMNKDGLMGVQLGLTLYFSQLLEASNAT
jgi:hypothetical protein